MSYYAKRFARLGMPPMLAEEVVAAIDQGGDGGALPIAEMALENSEIARRNAGLTPFDFGMEVGSPETHGPAIQAAIDYCHTQVRGTVWLPEIGTPYWASEKLIHKAGVSIRGHGGFTEIRAMAGMADTLLETDNFAGLMDVNEGLGGSQNFILENLVLNGNRSVNGADTDVAGDVLNLWGRNFKLINVYIKDAPRHGIQAFYANDGVISGQSPFNAIVDNLMVDVTGGHGIRWHISDSDWTNVKVASASQLETETYDAVNLTQGIRWVNGAIWKKGFHSNTHARGIFNSGSGASFSGINVEHGGLAGVHNTGSRVNYRGYTYNTFGPDIFLNEGNQCRVDITAQPGGGGATDSVIVNNSGNLNQFNITGTGGLAAVRFSGGVHNKFTGSSFNGTANPDYYGTPETSDSVNLSFQKSGPSQYLVKNAGVAP